MKDKIIRKLVNWLLSKLSKPVYVRNQSLEPGAKIHPVVGKAIKKAFELNGDDYYEFIDAIDMPALRYQRFTQFYSEANNRITYDDLKELTNESLKHLDSGEITKAIPYINEIKYRIHMSIDTDTVFNLLTCAFFTLEEDVTTYDFEYNRTKSELFEKHLDSFFLKEPMSRYFPLKKLSIENFQAFIKETKVRKRYLKGLKKLHLTKKDIGSLNHK